MKHIIRKALAALLTAALLTQSAAALSITGLGEITAIRRDQIGDGLLYTEYGSATQQSYIFEYDPAGGALPIVRYGTTVYGKDRLGSMAASEWSAGKVVFGGINGDFYSMQTGVPMGVMIEDGKLLSTDDSKYAVGFTADGKAVIGKPGVKVTITNQTRDLLTSEVDQVNKFPTQWGVYLLTDDFASTSLSAVESLEIVIRLEGDITASGSIGGTVVEVINGDCNTSIPDGCAVLTVANSYEDYPNFTGYATGDKIRINTTCADGWDKVTTAIGGGDLIVENGETLLGIYDEDHEKVANPRTAVGTKANGKVVFFAVDGRSTASRGLTEPELASVMKEFGCVTALNLDGGGSTTVLVKRSSATDSAYVNVPADGSYRSVANGILFVSKKASDGKMAAISPIPNTPTLLRGSSVTFSAQPLDAAYMPAGLIKSGKDVTLAFHPDYTYDAAAGSISGSTFTAGNIAGEYRLNVTVPNGLLRLTSEASVVVTSALDDLIVTPAYTKVKPGSLVELNINAIWGGKSVIASPDSFYYTLNGTHVVPSQKDYPGARLLCDVGYLDANGNFQTFAGAEGTVEIGVWFDQFVRYVTVNVGTGSDTVADFEDVAQFGNFTVTVDGSDLMFAPTASGYKSESALEIGFSYNSLLTKKVLDVKLREGFPVAESAESIKLWVSGDISGTPCAVIADENGTEYTLSYVVTKDYSRQLGWCELTAVIPLSLKNGPLTLNSLLTLSTNGTGSRRLILDDAIIYYGALTTPDITIPEHWAKPQLTMLYDMGVIQKNDCRIVDGTAAVEPDKQLTRGDFAKMLALWLGLDIYAFTEGIVVEKNTPEHQAQYIRAVIAHGLMSGRGTDENGVTLFDANTSITREEVFKVIGSLLDAQDTGLITFSDASAISDWALSGIRKCVNAGILSGYEDNTVRPGATITLAEMAALLAKM